MNSRVYISWIFIEIRGLYTVNKESSSRIKILCFVEKWNGEWNSRLQRNILKEANTEKSACTNDSTQNYNSDAGRIAPVLHKSPGADSKGFFLPIFYHLVPRSPCGNRSIFYRRLKSRTEKSSVRGNVDIRVTSFCFILDPTNS